MRQAYFRRLMRTIAPLLLLLCFPRVSPAYSVLTHEAIIDATWDSSIKPLLVQRFGSASPEDLRKAHAYAYGGAIIQDMGYYPFGSKIFSDLTHYVRSGHFVEVLIRDSQDLNEYAFALGALCHYVSDSNGHPRAVNPSVAMLYPKLQARYGNEITYEDNPIAHIRTEFAFDVVQVAHGHYASEDYHDFIGFQVSKPLLERAFKETYGIELKSIFMSLDLALGNFRLAVRTVIPKMTKVAWENNKEEIQKATPGMTREKFLYAQPNSDDEKRLADQSEKPGIRDKLLAVVLRVMPKIGPFKAMAFKPVTAETEKLFVESVRVTTGRYKELLAEAANGRLKLEDTDFDTGKPTRFGEYRMADHAYASLLERIARLHNRESIPPDLRENILAFFDGAGPSVAGRKRTRDWRETQRYLRVLGPTHAGTTGAAQR